MFWGVKCWRKGDLRPERIREAGELAGMPPGLVEREIIFYDTLEAICSLSPVPVVLKGGTLISRLYSECPRFSWDIDLSVALRSKEEYDLDGLNRRMEGRTARLTLGGEELELGRFERERERDVFVNLLPLARDMLTWSLGASLPVYLRKRGFKVEELRGEMLELRNRLGQLPFVESVRGTLSLTEVVAERRGEVGSLLQKVMRPVRRVRARIYPPELCLVEKLSRISRGVEEIGLRDLLCDFYDVGQLLRLDLSRRGLLEAYGSSYFRREAPGPALLQRRMREALSVVRRNLHLFGKRREFVWCRYDWEEYFSAVKEGVEELLGEWGRPGALFGVRSGAF
jgi:hypothetical protein